LVMGTRCGDIDPSLPQFLVKQLGVSIDEVTKILNRKSGLLGISGVSFDMRTLVDASEAGNHQAQLAIEIFCYRLAKYIGALAITLGRIDALIFTGGIGENSPIIREKVLSRLALLNFTVEKQANAENGCNNKGIITQVDSSTAIVVKTDEQLAIAREVQRMTN